MAIQADANRKRLSRVRQSVVGTHPLIIVSGPAVIHSMAAADNSINRTGGSYITDGFVAGQRITVIGFATAANNKTFTIISVVALKMVLEGHTVVTEAAGPSVTITANKLERYRYVSESLHQETGTVTSAEIRDDRNIADIIRTSVNAPGEVAIEVSAGAFDEEFKAALQSAGWSLYILKPAAITISAASGDNSFNDSATGFVTAGFVVNQWIEVRGFTNPANNGYFKIVSVTAAKIVVKGGTLVTEGAGPSVTVEQMEYITTGTVQRYYSLEGQLTDIAGEFQRWLDEVIGTLNLTIPTDGILTGSIGYSGKTETSAAVTLGDGADIPARTEPIMNSIDDVFAVREKDAPYDITGLTFNLTNNLRSRPQVATLGAISQGSGSIGITGTHTAYYATKVVMDRYLGFTETEIAVVLEDPNGNGYILDVPALKYTSGQRVAGGINTDIIADMAWTAKMHATENIMARLVRIGDKAA